ncbi:MAG TPA: hypothetical protein DEB30_05240 [Candidatus Peribacter riflensis]|uniref:DNA polymerase III subunit delta n=1 Tax=Candidatus Peribacter riflensis TaxID=1735162 RepID=A0A0S1SRL2_9BACT|nr:MAG: DNA polymerase III subunit delta' [Candidatus Peribacter riflensis]OGJ78461.1 MAG: hypothetical protein A2398_02345 [Candidatus Peribacteria bacterium RIFOXYB1_FULL_57_12]OGJ82115.1 MAG: hypothetical protein A2412_00120 [Candidatus Peribacteria bacterium RIFOXYC1_FULL_58_8]ALM11453.1 MAG: DNA polymerase III subunit delta' [Candidatus Peribacter riflensis]ALM12555.1 MAG: DNA polymerase III subunit delta' [Candidatus Peribacter riflensis]
MLRPKDIVGHHAVRAQLEHDLETENVSHAYLFAGPRHLGKMTLARWFALRLLSAGVPEEAEEHVRHACERMTHSDLFVLDQLWIADQCEDWGTIAQTSNAPQQEREKKKVKTDTIGIDDIRALQERLQETATGKYRCCIIRSAERMQSEAANALLKILEEPPPSLVFIFTTQALSSLLPTVVSRMRVFRFHPLSRPELLPLLDGVNEEDRQFILHLAQGAPGVAQELKHDPEALRIHRLVHTKAVSFWRTRSLKERLQILDPLTERGEEADQLLLHLALALREQSPASGAWVHALHELAQGLRTNAHRGLMTQRFALRVS